MGNANARILRPISEVEGQQHIDFDKREALLASFYDISQGAESGVILVFKSSIENYSPKSGLLSYINSNVNVIKHPPKNRFHIDLPFRHLLFAKNSSTPFTIQCATFNPTSVLGSCILTCCSDGYIRVYDSKNLYQIMEFDSRPFDGPSLAFTSCSCPTNNALLFAREDGSMSSLFLETKQSGISYKNFEPPLPINTITLTKLRKKDFILAGYYIPQCVDKAGTPLCVLSSFDLQTSRRDIEFFGPNLGTVLTANHWLCPFPIQEEEGQKESSSPSASKEDEEAKGKTVSIAVGVMEKGVQIWVCPVTGGKGQAGKIESQFIIPHSLWMNPSDPAWLSGVSAVFIPDTVDDHFSSKGGGEGRLISSKIVFIAFANHISLAALRVGISSTGDAVVQPLKLFTEQAPNPEGRETTKMDPSEIRRTLEKYLHEQKKGEGVSWDNLSHVLPSNVAEAIKEAVSIDRPSTLSIERNLFLSEKATPQENQIATLWFDPKSFVLVAGDCTGKCYLLSDVFGIQENKIQKEMEKQKTTETTPATESILF